MSKGDALARGARSATFTPNKKVSQDTWDAAFSDFDPETFLSQSNSVSENDPEIKTFPHVKVGI